jgi:hypothetical protein
MTTQTLYLINEYLMQGGYTPGIDAETLEREAHLIAAAPDLLAALEALIADCEAHGLTDNDAHLREARAAITKAKGN